MNHFLAKVRNIKQIKKQLEAYTKNKVMKRQCHPPIKNSLTNSKTFEFNIRHYKLFKFCSIKLTKLEKVLEKFDYSKKARVLTKRCILKPKIKVCRGVEEMFHKKPYVFIWNIHPRSKEMLFRSEWYGIWHFVKVNFSI